MTKYKWPRAAGVLMPVSSLPSSYGIGTLGKKAYCNASLEALSRCFEKTVKEFINSYEVVVSDIMKSNTRISGYQLEQKNIIIAKKEKNNINRLIDFINEYSISEKKKCLIIIKIQD